MNMETKKPLTDAEKSELLRAAVRKMKAEEEKADPGKFDRWPYVPDKPAVSFEEYMDNWNAKLTFAWCIIGIFAFMGGLGLLLHCLPNN